MTNLGAFRPGSPLCFGRDDNAFLLPVRENVARAAGRMRVAPPYPFFGLSAFTRAPTTSQSLSSPCWFSNRSTRSPCDLSQSSLSASRSAYGMDHRLRRSAGAAGRRSPRHRVRSPPGAGTSTPPDDDLAGSPRACAPSSRAHAACASPASASDHRTRRRDPLSVSPQAPASPRPRHTETPSYAGGPRTGARRRRGCRRARP